MGCDAKLFVSGLVDHPLAAWTAIAEAVCCWAVKSNNEEAVFSEGIRGN
jgi:hypothetical protein